MMDSEVLVIRDRDNMIVAILRFNNREPVEAGKVTKWYAKKHGLDHAILHGIWIDTKSGPNTKAELELGCGRMVHVIGTNGGVMTCGGELTVLNGGTFTYLCEECREESVPDAPAKDTGLTWRDVVTGMRVRAKTSGRHGTVVGVGTPPDQGDEIGGSVMVHFDTDKNHKHMQVAGLVKLDPSTDTGRRHNK